MSLNKIFRHHISSWKYNTKSKHKAKLISFCLLVTCTRTLRLHSSDQKNIRSPERTLVRHDIPQIGRLAIPTKRETPHQNTKGVITHRKTRPSTINRRRVHILYLQWREYRLSNSNNKRSDRFSTCKDRPARFVWNFQFAARCVVLGSANPVSRRRSLCFSFLIPSSRYVVGAIVPYPLITASLPRRRARTEEREESAQVYKRRV